MPDVLLFILAVVIFFAGFMSFADKCLKKFAPYIIMVGVLLGAWTGIYLSKVPKIISEEIVSIIYIEDTNGDITQIANYKNEIINITKRFQKYFPDDKYRLKIIKYDEWRLGVLTTRPSIKYELIDEQGKTVD